MLTYRTVAPSPKSSSSIVEKPPLSTTEIHRRLWWTIWSVKYSCKYLAESVTYFCLQYFWITFHVKKHCVNTIHLSNFKDKCVLFSAVFAVEKNIENNFVKPKSMLFILSTTWVTSSEFSFQISQWWNAIIALYMSFCFNSSNHRLSALLCSISYVDMVAKWGSLF